MLIRWMYADDEATVLRWLAEIPDDIWEPDSLTFAIGTEPLYLFDAACAGHDVGTDICPCLITEFASGLYAVTTGSFEPDANTSLVLHRFALM